MYNVYDIKLKKILHNSVSPYVVLKHWTRVILRKLPNDYQKLKQLKIGKLKEKDCRKFDRSGGTAVPPPSRAHCCIIRYWNHSAGFSVPYLRTSNKDQNVEILSFRKLWSHTLNQKFQVGRSFSFEVKRSFVI